MSKNPVVHFEMPYKNGKRVSEFYKKAFGWVTKQMGAEMGNYIVVHTAETDKNNVVKTPGTINGGFYDIKMPQATKEPSIVISVKDVKAAAKKIEKAGGKMLTKPQDIPGVGIWVSFKDTEGNRVSILQAQR